MNRLVRRKLLDARRFLVLESTWTSLGWWVAAGLAVWTGIRAVDFWRPLPQYWNTAWLPLALACILGAAATGLWRWRRLADVADASDRRTGTHDRFVTSLHLPSGSSFAGTVEREILSYVSAWKPAGVFRGGVHRRAAWLALPLLVLAGLEVMRWRTEHAGASDRASAQELITQAENAAARHAPADPQLRAAQELLREAMQRIDRSPDPLREALRALSEAARQAESSAQGLSSAEAEAVASALASRNPEAAEHLRAQQFAEAAEAMEKMDPAALAEALEEAARHREMTRLQDLAREEASQAQAQLGTLTRNTSGANGQQARQKFLSALQQIKDRNMSNPASQDSSDPGSAPSLAEHAPGSEQAAPSAEDQAPPSGRPGTETDEGRGADVAGETESAAESRREDALAGQAGDGPALARMLRTSVNDDPEAKRAFRQVYESAASAALDAIENEPIPPGSRLLVRRYFEAIRPAE